MRRTARMLAGSRQVLLKSFDKEVCEGLSNMDGTLLRGPSRRVPAHTDASVQTLETIRRQGQCCGGYGGGMTQ